MKRSVRLRRWRVSNTGILRERSVEIGPLGPGVNVIAGPNECGKSTMMRALQAALFDRWSFRGQHVRELQPNGTKLAPLVEVELEVDGVVHRLRKQLSVSPAAQLTIGDDPRVYTNDEADALIRAALDAHEGNKQGSTADDMGLWGLLWVRQDEYATKEPAKSMGKHVRADLDGIIKQQTILGGDEGVALYQAIGEACQRHYTAKLDKPTGALAAAQAEVEALEREIADHRREVAEGEAVGTNIDRLESALRDADERATELERELANATSALETAAVLERERAEAERDVAAARDVRARSEAAWRRREEQRVALREQERAADVQRAALEPLQQSLADATRRLDESRGVCAAAGQSLEAQRQRSERIVDRLDRLDLEAGITRHVADVAEARRRQAEIEEAARLLERLPSEERLAEMEAMRDEAARRRVHVERPATRVVSCRTGELERIEVVTRAQTIEFGTLGSLDVEPAHTGFAQHLARWREVSEQLRLALARARVSTVRDAAARFEAGARLCEVREKHDAALAQQAPDGVDALRSEHARAEQEFRDAVRARDDARELSEQLARLESELQALATDPIDEREVRAIATRLEALAHVRSMGVRVRVSAVGEAVVPVAWADEARAVVTSAGAVRDVVEPVVLLVDDRLRVEIDPGDLTTQAAARVRLERERDRRLAALGVDTIEEWENKCAQRSRQEGARDDVAQRLTKLCPNGLLALEERVERLRKTAQGLKRRLDEVAVLVAALPAQPRGDEAPVTADALEELRALDRDSLFLEQEVRRTAPRITGARGPLSAVAPLHAPIIEELRIAIDAGTVTIVPGEAQADAGLALLEQRLRLTLEAAGVASVEEARARNRESIEIAAGRRANLEAVARIAPAGLAALEAELATLQARRERLGAAPQEDAEARPALVAQREQVRRDVADAEAALRIHTETVARQTAEVTSLRAAIDATRMEIHRLDGASRASRDALDAECKGQPDATLQAALQGAQTDCQTAEARLALVRSRLEDTNAARLREAIAQWQQRLDAHLAERGGLRDDLLRQRTRLEEFRRHAQYDALQEKCVALEEVRERLRKIETEAGAVRLLWSLSQAEFAAAEEKLLLPVRQAAARLLPILWPDSSIDLDRDTWQVTRVIRAGVAETFDALSGGAREQLAIIVRIALAQVLAKERTAMPLILDDVLGWTDDGRLRQMLAVLERAAQDMQVIVLTCHPRRFERFVGAQHFNVQQLTTAAAAS